MSSVDVTREYTITNNWIQNNCSLSVHHFLLSNFSLFLTFNTLISHVRTNPHLKWEKFSIGAAAQLSPEWHKLIELMVWVSEALQASMGSQPQRAVRGSVVCRGHVGFSWQGPPEVPATARMKRILWVDTRWQELMWSSTSVTAFISYAMPLIPWSGDISDTVF